MALLSDLFRVACGNFLGPDKEFPPVHEIQTFNFSENEIYSMHVGIWLFHHPLFAGKPELLPSFKHFLLNRLPTLCSFIQHQQWIDDEDRAEEFIREALQYCNMLLDGETAEEAQDKLDALSTLKRNRVLEETNESLLRMKAIREAMAAQKAREAANVYGRE